MEIKLKDVIHLYVGCEFIKTTPSKRYLLCAVNINDKTILRKRTSWDNECDTNEYYLLHESLSNIHLLLRPLSTMTEEEMVELIRVEHPENEYPILGNVKMVNNVVSFGAKDSRMRYFTIFSIGFSGYTPKETLWLLSHGFDIFELIESGQAIDKTN